MSRYSSLNSILLATTRATQSLIKHTRTGLSWDRRRGLLEGGGNVFLLTKLVREKHYPQEALEPLFKLCDDLMNESCLEVSFEIITRLHTEVSYLLKIQLDIFETDLRNLPDEDLTDFCKVLLSYDSQFFTQEKLSYFISFIKQNFR